MTSRRGWWRRNAVALAALLPVVAAAVWVSSADARDRYLDHANHQQVGPGADGWIVLGDSSFRLDELAPLDAADLTAIAGPGTALPAGTMAWQLTGTLRTSTQTPTLCGLSVQASDGRRYSAGPRDLGDGYLNDCLRIDLPPAPADPAATAPTASSEPSAPADLPGTALFLIPADATPQQLRIADRYQAPTLGLADVGR
ncbi:hypothetical protein [Nakamurella lactea]|uniref:hypothetical protein n=1 Tax=Nakamurella lactea TaxID=459515 RepID=UPI00041DE896|nr:hypothetical protein [Nakamurella lactea]